MDFLCPLLHYSSVNSLLSSLQLLQINSLFSGIIKLAVSLKENANIEPVQSELIAGLLRLERDPPQRILQSFNATKRGYLIIVFYAVYAQHNNLPAQFIFLGTGPRTSWLMVNPAVALSKSMGQAACQGTIALFLLHIVRLSHVSPHVKFPSFISHSKVLLCYWECSPAKNSMLCQLQIQ